MSSINVSLRLASAVLLLCALHSGAQGQDADNERVAYREGKDYSLLPMRTRTENDAAKEADSENVEVVAVFSYACPFCYKYESTVTEWLKTKDDSVAFRREHMASGRALENLARAYYIAEDLKILPKTHDALFKAIHVFELEPYGEDDLQRMYKRLADVDSKTFSDKFWSSEIHERVKESKKTLRDWRITGVPCVVVGGRYLVDAEMSDGEASKMFAVVDYLVTKIQGERDPSADPPA